MPRYNPTEDDMDESYAAPPKTAPEESEPAESVDEESAGAATAIVDNKILSPEGEPLKEGDQIIVRVVKNYGDESEIAYAPKGGEETEDEETEVEEPMSVAGRELTALAEEGA